MFCKNCGKQLLEGERFCAGCGTPTENSAFNAEPVGEVKEYNLITAYKSMFKNYANFKGRSRRSEYWYAALMQGIIGIVGYFLGPFLLLMGVMAESDAVLMVSIVFCALLILYCAASFVPSLALGVRRLHDTGKSGWFMLLSLVPYVGSIIVIVFMALDSTLGANQYGPNPKGR